MFYLSDEPPGRNIRAPYVTWALLAINVAIFLLGIPPRPFDFEAILLLDPAHAPEAVRQTPLMVRLITYQFLHGGLVHLAGNMIVLWVFGRTVEDATGHWRFLGFYLAAGAAGALAEAVFGGNPYLRVVGASGAIAGVMGGYLLLHPKARLLMIVGAMPVLVPASLGVGFWVAMNLWAGLAAGHVSAAGGTAYWGHIGGFVAGLALMPFAKFIHVRLFQPHNRRWDGDLRDFHLLRDRVRAIMAGWSRRPVKHLGGPAHPHPGSLAHTYAHWSRPVVALGKSVLLVAAFLLLNVLAR